MALPLASGVLAAKCSLAVLLLLFVLSASPPACHATARNITAILAAYPDFGEFSSQLRSEGLADDISRLNGGPITVLAVNDAGMAWIKTTPREAIWGRLSLHVLLDCYYDDAKLQRLPLGGAALVSTLFLADGHGPGAYGMVRIVKFPDERGGVGFLPVADDDVDGVGKSAFFVRSAYGAPDSSISVLQVSGVMLTSPISPDAARGFDAHRY